MPIPFQCWKYFSRNVWWAIRTTFCPASICPSLLKWHLLWNLWLHFTQTLRNIRRKRETIDGESLWVGSFLWLPWQPNTNYSKVFSSILAGQISYKKFTEIFLEGLSFKIVQRISFCKKNMATREWGLFSMYGIYI